jgi:hypothetical protein
MLQALFIFPFPFWVVVALLIGGGIWALRHLRDGTGIPTLAVLVTVAFWYVGDALYNDYANYHATLFASATLAKAWWQVTWFLVVFLVATPWLHRHFNAPYLRQTSGVLQLFKGGVGQPAFQKQLQKLFQGSALIWSVLAVIAVILLRERALLFFFPFFGEKTSPWTHGRIGKGFDALSIVALHVHHLIAATFGVIAALSTNHRTRMFALFCCLTSWPYFVLDRTRYIILMLVVPGILCWVLLRLRGGMLNKITVLGLFFLLINAWMGFVIANRTGTTIIGALKEKGFSVQENQKVRHEGLNMYEELCWLNTFFQQGSYTCNWGYRYYTELVNPIPRGLWPGKPMIGLDYAFARGQGGSDDVDSGGVYATISTGMIGQGVVNFSTVVGPAFAALLMSFWLVILARLDLHIHEFGRLPLYGLGLILTFNLGRDITLVTLYPFIFGVMLVWWRERSIRAGRPAQFRQPSQAKSGLLPRQQQRPVPRATVGLTRKRNFDYRGKGNGRPIISSKALLPKPPVAPLQPET